MRVVQGLFLEKDTLDYVVINQQGHYQTISLVIDSVLRNGTLGNYLERKLEIKNFTVAKAVHIPLILNAGTIQEVAVFSYVGSKVKLLYGDDAGNLHVIESDKVVKSIKLSTEPIVGLSVQNMGAIYYSSNPD